MQQKLRFTWDQRGYATVLAEPPHDVLAGYLAEELQTNAPVCRRVLDTIQSLRVGRRSSWDTEGQAWSVSLNRVRAAIVSEYAVPGRSLDLTLEEFEDAVGSWLRFIELSRV
jgi:uncharacterized protein YacL (UPF0231 family)